VQPQLVASQRARETSRSLGRCFKNGAAAGTFLAIEQATAHAPSVALSADGDPILHGSTSGQHLAQRARHLAALLIAAALVGPRLAAAAPWSLPPDLRSQQWLDSDRQIFSLSMVQAPIVVMTMAYTACRRICSTTALVLSDLQQRLDTAGQPAEFIIVSYDPSNDSPADWRDYRTRRGLTRSTWHFLTGETAATRLLARYLDLDFWSYHDHIVHDFRIVLFDARWRVLGEVDWSSTDKLADILGESLTAVRR
jgi:cytochrome oxidase Cu insertion factor (SCO1/SenC/PrrC family)